jgi:hypothetical protein
VAPRGGRRAARARPAALFPSPPAGQRGQLFQFGARPGRRALKGRPRRPPPQRPPRAVGARRCRIKTPQSTNRPPAWRRGGEPPHGPLIAARRAAQRPWAARGRARPARAPRLRRAAACWAAARIAMPSLETPENRFSLPLVPFFCWPHARRGPRLRCPLALCARRREGASVLAFCFPRPGSSLFPTILAIGRAHALFLPRRFGPHAIPGRAAWRAGQGGAPARGTGGAFLCFRSSSPSPVATPSTKPCRAERPAAVRAPPRGAHAPGRGEAPSWRRAAPLASASPRWALPGQPASCLAGPHLFTPPTPALRGNPLAAAPAARSHHPASRRNLGRACYSRPSSSPPLAHDDSPVCCGAARRASPPKHLCSAVRSRACAAGPP